MFINPVNFSNYYNNRLLTMGKKSSFEKIETQKDLIKAIEELKNLSTVNEKYLAMNKITISAYNMSKRISLDDIKPNIIDVMLDAVTEDFRNNEQGFLYFVAVQSFAKYLCFWEEKQTDILEKVKEYGFKKFKTSLYYNERTGRTCSYSDLYGETTTKVHDIIRWRRR